MSFRKQGDPALERRLKRRLGRYKLDLLKAQKPSPQVRAHGGYKIREALTGKILFGEARYEFSATIEDVEAWLDAEEKKLESD
ncbi:MAG: hypothetical protein ABIO40_06080 [Devosia sp.]